MVLMANLKGKSSEMNHLSMCFFVWADEEKEETEKPLKLIFSLIWM